MSTQKDRLEPGPNIRNGLLLQEKQIARIYTKFSDHRKYGAFLFALLAVLEKPK